MNSPAHIASIRWNKRSRKVESIQALVERVMVRWRQKKDTAQIARALMEPESAVATALRIGRDQERAA